jgi:mannose-6-phosphate isomerase class I
MLHIALSLPVPRVWGGLPGPSGEPVGELWWIHHDGGGSTRLTGPDGSPTGSIAGLVSSGRLRGNPFFPLLVKTLHTADRLSVQVHPGVSGNGESKEETWVVLRAGAGSWMMAGFRRETSREEMAAAIGSGNLAELILERAIAPGDVVHLPPGTIHAMGPGATVLEVQSNCDVTYRLYDWDRKGTDGRPRRLDTGRGLDAVDFSPGGGPLFSRTDDCREEGVPGPRGYSLRPVDGPRGLDLPPGHVFFLTGGTIALAGVRSLQGPCCLIADSDGGRLDLDAGAAGWKMGVR